MKKYLLIFLFAFTIVFSLASNVAPIHAQTPTPDPNTSSVQPPDGTWLSDNEVTFAGKNAARSKDLFNWVLVNYQWSTKEDTLIAFWAKIRNVVFVFLILLVMISAFLMIITGGQSLTAMQFIRKFLVVIILITFSYAMIRFLYQVVDIIQSFFIKNPDGQVISSKDLLNISFDYDTFVGYRRYGSYYNESAFISLLLTKITAATYFVMAGILIVRKVILWFFITVSPIYPILLLYFPIRNTAKIWIGEFFRWLLYAPLFAIFLSGLVVVWRDNINVLPFNFSQPIKYPTAINILLGGPGQTLAIDNNINNNDTFAEYIVALIMLWVVIFLPFLLLRIFLDYISNTSFTTNPAWKYIVNNANRVLPSNDFFNLQRKTPPSTPPPVPSYPTGIARPIPFPTGQTREIPMARPISEAATTISKPLYQAAQRYNTKNVSHPVFKSENSSVSTSQLVNFSIPTMRDVARYETSHLSSQISSKEETSHVQQTLQKIASPQSIMNPVERQQYSTIHEKLVQASKQGEPLATSILNAANHISKTNISSTTNISQTLSSSQTTQQNISQVTQNATTQVQQVLQKMSNPQSVTNVSEKEQIAFIKEKFTQLSQQGNSFANTVLHTINNSSNQNTQQSSTQVQQIVEKLAHPEKITNETERQQITQLKETLTQEKAKGNQVASSILTSVENVQKAQTAQTSALPQVNAVQTVNLEDYEEVKKTWTENYRKVEVPKTFDAPNRTRQQWVQEDLSKTTHAIDLLTSKDQKNVEEGMKEVSALLPFLLLGGFSQTEVVAYLQAKKHAAEEVLTETKQKETEEDTLLETTTRATQTQQTMHMDASVEPTVSTTTVTNNDDYDESPLSQITNVTANTNQTVQNNVFKPETHQTMQLVNFTIPTMREVAQYEAANISKQHPIHTQVEQMHEMIQKLSNPEIIHDEKERQTYTVMKQQLIEAKNNGDPLAVSILTTVQNMTPAAQHGQAPVAMPTALPQTNNVQTVNLEDYEDVRKTWQENYKTIDVPKSLDKPERTRSEWVEDDVAKTKNAINLLSSQDVEQKKQGMQLVSELLPFLLLGGFSETEIIAYLQAKEHAGEDVLKEEKEKENEETKIDVESKEEDKNKEMQVEEEKKDA